MILPISQTKNLEKNESDEGILVLLAMMVGMSAALKCKVGVGSAAIDLQCVLFTKCMK